MLSSTGSTLYTYFVCRVDVVRRTPFTERHHTTPYTLQPEKVPISTPPPSMDNEPERQSGHASPVVRSSLEADLNRNLCLEDKLRRDDNEEPQELLKRLLPTRSGISTTSSFAEHQQSAIGCQTSFREIGRGSIGKVFEQPGSVWAFKALLIDRIEKLWNNYLIHLRIQESFDTLGTLSGQVEVPRVAWFANEASKFWDDNLEFFPNDPTFPRRPREILCMERVFPLPEPVRHALIDMFCNPTNSTAAKAHPANKDCLVKLFLGRKRFGSSRPGGSMFFSLRNYKLHIDQVQSLQLDAEEYAKSMAGAPAVLHWHTQRSMQWTLNSCLEARPLTITLFVEYSTCGRLKVSPLVPVHMSIRQAISQTSRSGRYACG